MNGVATDAYSPALEIATRKHLIPSGRIMKFRTAMTFDQVREVIRLQISDAETHMNAHGISLNQTLVQPKKISVIARTITRGRVNDEEFLVWLVGQENSIDGYKIIMRDDRVQFGLASRGFPTDKHVVLVGWYGDLISAFANM